MTIKRPVQSIFIHSQIAIMNMNIMFRTCVPFLTISWAHGKFRIIEPGMMANEMEYNMPTDLFVAPHKYRALKRMLKSNILTCRLLIRDDIFYPYKQIPSQVSESEEAITDTSDRQSESIYPSL